MRRLLTTALLGATLATGAATPALADRDDVRREVREERKDKLKAQRRYDRALRRGDREEIREARRDLREERRDYARATRKWQSYGRYDHNRVDPRYGNHYADRYYRDGSNYRPRALSYDDRIYRGQDGRYYCRRSDGTTGLIVGALGGGVLGNVIAPGGSKTLGSLIGAGLGAVLGRVIDRGRAVCQ